MTNETSVDVIQTGAHLAEGPVWDSRQARLLWVDILRGLVHSTDPSTGETDTLELDKPVGAVGLRSGGGLVVAVEDGFALVDTEWQEVQQVATLQATDPACRFNDGKCDPRGRFWAGTMAYDEIAGAGAASLYQLSPELAVETILTGITISNGLGWSSDQRTFFYTDSPTHSVDAFDYDAETGALANRRRVITIEGGMVPDGLALDADGCLWVAIWDGGEVRRYTPDGVLDRKIALPVTKVTSCAFGGSQLDTLFVTSAVSDLNDQEKERQPLAGAVFAVNPHASGLLPHEFGG